ncbi:hypothetical protein BN1723_019282, partial [Verticillium longisporum]
QGRLHQARRRDCPPEC